MLVRRYELINAEFHGAQVPFSRRLIYSTDKLTNVTCARIAYTIIIIIIICTHIYTKCGEWLYFAYRR